MLTLNAHISRGARRRTLLSLAALALASAAVIAADHRAAPVPSVARVSTAAGARNPVHVHKTVHPRNEVRLWTIHYRAHNGADRLAFVLLPAWYGPRHNPPLPLVISPHGRGANGRSNAKFFADLPSTGRFAVVSPDGMGRRLNRFSYGYPGQVDDLAKMPEFAVKSLPWLRIDRRRIYALGSSMGGQETALLVARHPRLLAGAAAMDSVTDLSRRYGQLLSVPCNRRCLQRLGRPQGVNLQSLMRREVGGTPTANPRAYAARSPLSLARRIAFSRVPLQIWWSRSDRIVSDQQNQSGALLRTVRRLNPCAPVTGYVGRWQHSTEMRAKALLPIALEGFHLLPRSFKALPGSVRFQSSRQCGR